MTKMTRVGTDVICTTCGTPKAPLGRSVPLGTMWCDRDTCLGYSEDPQPDYLFPGEEDWINDLLNHAE